MQGLLHTDMKMTTGTGVLQYVCSQNENFIKKLIFNVFLMLDCSKWSSSCDVKYIYGQTLVVSNWHTAVTRNSMYRLGIEPNVNRIYAFCRQSATFLRIHPLSSTN